MNLLPQKGECVGILPWLLIWISFQSFKHLVFLQDWFCGSSFFDLADFLYVICLFVPICLLVFQASFCSLYWLVYYECTILSIFFGLLLVIV